ncbi:hypothetical protein [Janthinobacterium sp.]|uniref:hypothetical protein n=1 Tax=Janthinobacterium sp. TaxID=1871054 RepID=UPI002619BC15|nr:hypothetical protein [Janthinobacterium sp.]
MAEDADHGSSCGKKASRRAQGGLRLSCHDGELFREDIDAQQATAPAIFRWQNLSQHITE